MKANASNPRGEISLERIEKMLLVCAELVDRRGPDRATSARSARARVSRRHGTRHGRGPYSKADRRRLSDRTAAHPFAAVTNLRSRLPLETVTPAIVPGDEHRVQKLHQVPLSALEADCVETVGELWRLFGEPLVQFLERVSRYGRKWREIGRKEKRGHVHC